MRQQWKSTPMHSASKVRTLTRTVYHQLSTQCCCLTKKTNSRTSPDLLRRVLPVLRDAAAAAHQHAAAGSVQHPESRGDGLHAQDGQPPLRQHHAGAQVDASAHAARLPQHQHGPKHQHHTGSAGGPLLCHGKEVSAASCHT